MCSSHTSALHSFASRFPRLLEPSELLEQAPRAVGPARVDAETLEQASSSGGCAVGFDLVHVLSVCRLVAGDIGPRADFSCG